MKVGVVTKILVAIALCFATVAVLASRRMLSAHAAPLPQAAISIPAGTSVEIRAMELIDSNSASNGQQFRGTTATPTCARRARGGRA